MPEGLPRHFSVRIASGARTMDSLEESYWSRLQVELWVCTRSREAVGLAEYAPGRTRITDLSIGPDGLDDEAHDQDPPMFDDEIDLIGMAIINYGFVCPFEDAQKEVLVALSKGQLKEHLDRGSGAEFFEREEVLRLWPDPRWETLTAISKPLTLAEARGLPASKDAWADCAEASCLSVRGGHVPAAIPPAQKRGPRPRYQWPMVHEFLDELITSKGGNISRAEATKATLEWCAMQWGGEDGPGEPSEAMVRKHVGAHPAAPWAFIRTDIPTPGGSGRPTAMTNRQLSVIQALRVEASTAKKWTFSIKEFNELCDRSGAIDPALPPSSQRRLKCDLKQQLTNKGLIAGDGQTIRLVSPS